MYKCNGVATNLGFSKAHIRVAILYYQVGDLNKDKFHYKAAAMAGDELARCNLGGLEANSGNME